MLDIGFVNKRKIFLLNVRTDKDWQVKLPSVNWIALTISNSEDKEFLSNAVTRCLNNDVCYTCSVGELAEFVEELFDEEIVERGMNEEEGTGKAFNYDISPVTSNHKNLAEGFWFATTAANAEDRNIDKVVCLNFTTQDLDQQLSSLSLKINNGWLPLD